MSKRTVCNWPVLLTCGLALSVIAAGCSQSSPGNQKQADAPGAKTEKKRGKITVSIYDQGQIPAEAGNSQKNSWATWVNEKGPVDVQYVPITRRESTQIYNTLFASGGAPDLITEYDDAYRNSLYTQKQLMPLDDMIDKYSTEYKKLMQQYPMLKKLGTKPDGKIYEIGRVQKMVTNHVMFIRTDWLKKLNLEVPKTTEDLYKVAKAFAEQDPDGNGKKDTFGTSLSFMSGDNIREMFGDVGWVVSNDQIVRDWDRIKEHTVFRKKLYDEGIVDKDFLADKNGAKAEKDWVNGKLGIFGIQNGVKSTGYKVFTTFKKNNPDATILPIELPKSSFGQFSPYLEPPVRMVSVVNAKAKDPEAVMKYIDFMITPSTMNTIKYGIEGVHSKKDSSGCYQAIDEEKSKKEVMWNQYFQGFFSTIMEGDCASFEKSLDMSKPVNKEFASFVPIADKAYLSKERPIPDVTSKFYWPSLPQEVSSVETNLSEAINELMIKAIVSGSSYTVDQAIQEAKSTWDKGGGKKVEEWYKKWYADNKNSSLLTKDLYEN
ncbi:MULTISPECIES: extracellular solute-binding protein [unclassified Paenibacillus]|uniref:extracellular solute-binding protein n=1 Tax=unclassified Paenibacillus TaxID=185978 RepID=UPI00363A1AF3